MTKAVTSGGCHTQYSALLTLTGIASGYASAAILFFALIGQSVPELVMLLAGSVPSVIDDFLAVGGFAGAGLVLAVLLMSAPARQRLPEALVALVLCNILFLAFTSVKLTLPYVVPFHADGWMAKLDASLHFGVDPWRITHALLGGLDMSALTRLYFDIWLLPAMYLPVLLLLFEADERRRVRFIWLWASCWLLLGTVLAAAFMSGGPVYHDLLVAPDKARFGALLERIGQPDATLLKSTQDWLWAAYLDHDVLIGSGISAFPSVHVGVATVLALYLWEMLPGRPWFGLRPNRWVPAVVLAFYVVLSVHLGWHYAVDAYASVLIIGALAWPLRLGPFRPA